MIVNKADKKQISDEEMVDVFGVPRRRKKFGKIYESSDAVGEM